jgi:carbamoyl-phosphate synthase large subunit
MLHWPLENEEPNVSSCIENGTIDFVLNIPKNYKKEEVTNDYLIRRKAVDFGVPLLTNMELAKAFFDAVLKLNPDDLKIKAWDEY